MNSEGIQFNGGMPILQSGSVWYNPRTNHTIRVSDNYFDNGEFRVRTQEGQILDYDMFKDYIQINNDQNRLGNPEITTQESSPRNNIFEPTHKVSEAPKKTMKKNISKKINNDSDIIIPEDIELLNKNTNKTQTSIRVSEPANTDMEIVKRLLDQYTKSGDFIEYKVIWNKTNLIPGNILKIIINELNIPINTICEYLLSQINNEDIINNIKSQMNILINNQIKQSNKNNEESSSNKTTKNYGSKRQKTTETK